MKLFKNAKRGKDKELLAGAFYTTHRFEPHSHFFVRLTDENGDIAFSLEMTREDALHLNELIGQYLDKVKL